MSVEQLRINQRIGQAGVKRGNEGLTRLGLLEAKVNAPPPAPAPRPPLELTAFASVERDGSTAGPPGLVPVDGLGNDVPALPGQPVPSAPAPIVAAPREADPAPVGVARVEAHQPPGRYTVRLTRPAWTCAVQATVTDFQGGQVMASPPFADAVVVATWAVDGIPAPRAFHLTVFCPTR